MESWTAYPIVEREAEGRVVLRLLRGEDIGEVSREARMAPPELERWRRVFLDGGQRGLMGKNRARGELMRTRAKLLEMTMRVELQAELCEKWGYVDGLRKLSEHSGALVLVRGRIVPTRWRWCAKCGGWRVRACMRCGATRRASLVLVNNATDTRWGQLASESPARETRPKDGAWR